MDFDTPVDRAGTWAGKWVDMNEGVIPLWMADMDLPCPEAVTSALVQRAAHPMYGYTRISPGFWEALIAWYDVQYGLRVEPRDCFIGPGVVPSLGAAVRALSNPGDGVLIFTPVYHPFFDMILHNGRTPVEIPLVLDGNGRYRFTESMLEQGLAAARRAGLQVPLILFSSPHNPGGAVWDQEELEVLLAFARRAGMILVSDEIHSDFVFPPKRFISAAALPDCGDITVIVSGANKTFNLGGLQGSHFITRNSGMRSKLKEALRGMAFQAPSLFFLTAVEAAYRDGGPWVAELKGYVRDNIHAAAAYLNGEIPGLRAYTPEGTYLIWADVSALIRRLGLRGDQELARALEAGGRVKVSAGTDFGDAGAGFIRINAACPRSQLMEGLRRLRRRTLTSGG